MGDARLTPLDWPDAPSERAPVPPLSLWFGRGAALGLVASVAILLATGWSAYLHGPYGDVHDWADQVVRAERTGDWLTYAWLPHTDQRIPIVRVIEALDVELGRGRAPLFLFAGAAALLCGVACLWTTIARSGAAAATRQGLTVITGLLLSNVAIGEDLAFPVFSVYLLVAGPALAAICLIQQGPRGGLRSPALWASLGFATLASLGNAAGLAVWPALLVCAWTRRPGGGPFWLIVISAVLVCGLVESGLGAPAHGTPVPLSAEHLLKMIRYAGSFAGLPWSRAFHPPAVGEALGLGIVAAGAAAAIGTGRSRHPELTGAGRGLLVFGILAVLLAAVGRVDELADPVAPTRYAPFALLLQAGLALRFSDRLEDAFRRSPGWTIALILLFGVLALGADVRGSALLQGTAVRIREAQRAFDQGRITAGLPIYPDAPRARTVRLVLRARNLPLD